MKIAKRALVLIMAVAMVCCMSAMAFAAGSISLSASEVNDKGVATITVTANNMIGLKSFDFTVTADDGISVVKVATTSDADQSKLADNAYNSEFNKDNGKFSGYFKNELWDLATYNEKAEENLEELDSSFNPASFVLGVISVKVDTSVKGPLKVYVKGATKGVELSVDQSVVVVKGEEPQTEAPKTEAPKTEAPKTEAPKTEAPKTEAPKTEAPKTEAPKTEAPKTEAPKTEAPKTEAPKTEAPKTEAPTTVKPVDTGDSTPNAGDKPTGDNMALAAAASVVALAGAAFVITKKRK